MHHSSHLYMTNYNLNANQETPEIYKHPWYTQQSLLENTTDLESQFPQKLRSEGTGPRSIKSIEWAAGLFEGEGCLSYDKSGSGRWKCLVEMTDYDCLYDFYTAINCGRLFKLNERPNAPSHYKPTYRWTVTKKDHIFNVVQHLFPYLNARRQAKIKEFLAWYFRGGA